MATRPLGSIPTGFRLEDEEDAELLPAGFRVETPEPPTPPGFHVETPEDDSFLDKAVNVLAGAGERAADLGGALIQTVETVGAGLEKQFPLGGFVWESGDILPSYKSPQEFADTDAPPILSKGADVLKNIDLGYQENINWQDVKQAFSDGGPLSGSAYADVIGYGLEQGIKSIPDMVAVVYALPTYIFARSGEIGEQRAQNKGKEKAELVDVLEAAPFAAASALLERIGAKGMTSDLKEELGKEMIQAGIKESVKRSAQAGGRALAKEAATEAIQEGMIEYVGERFGTEAKLDFNEALDRAAGAAVAGGLFGGAVGTGVSAINEIRRAPSDAAKKQAQLMDRLQQSAEAIESTGTVEEALDVANQIIGNELDQRVTAPGAPEVVTPEARPKLKVKLKPVAQPEVAIPEGFSPEIAPEVTAAPEVTTPEAVIPEGFSPVAQPEVVTPPAVVYKLAPKEIEALQRQGYNEKEIDAIDTGVFGKQIVSDSFVNRIKKTKDNAKTKFRQAVVDQFASFKEVMKDDRSWMLSHLTSSAPGAIEATVNLGTPYLDKSGVIGVDTNKKSLNEVLGPLGDDLERWTFWMAGNRSNRLIKEGKEHLFDQEKIDTLMGMNRGNEKLFNKVRMDFENMNNAVTKIAVDTGLVNAEEAKQWRDEGFYLPFYRILNEDETARGPRSMGGGGLVRQQAYKVLKGGKEPIGDLMTNVLMNWNHLVSASLKNQSATAALDTAVDLGIATEVSAATKSKDAVYIRKDGREVWYEVSDPLVLDSLMSLNWEGLKGRGMDTMRAFKRALTIGVTASPEFKIRNLIRDSIHAMGVTSVSPDIVKNLYQGFKATKQGADVSAQMLAGGGSFGQSGYIHGSDPVAIKRLLAKSGKTVDQIRTQSMKESILDTGEKFKKIWDAYQDFGARLENVNRAADYTQALERGVDRLSATFNARDHLDFTRTGSMPAVRFIAQTVPFLNARLQGLDKLARAAPGTMREWIDPKEAAQFKAVIGVYSAMSVALYLAMKDDEDYKAADEWEKRSYHLFKLPGSEIMYRIPRPFEVGAIAYMAESLAQQMADDKVHGELFAERLGHTLADTLSFNPVPQIFKPGLEVAMDKNLFTGRPIESQSMKRLSPERRKRVWTSETAIGVSEGFAKIGWDKVQLSPVQIEHLVQGYLGWMGAKGLAAVDMLITRPFTDAPSAPAMKLSEYPVIKVFVKTMPAKNTKYTTEFYEQLNELNTAFNDIRDAKKAGELDAVHYLIKKNPNLEKKKKFYNKQRDKLSKLNKRMQIVHRGKLDPLAKRAELDRLTVIKNQLTRIIAERVGG